ncbi:hypothetical protein PV327_010912 [Microctonus hyperodae]|uniref:Adenomatous polyposis coli protein n=1 Tax=Microctonus hyperodae TaxID=165561 RepID=A0AA39C993_MICHY|nr:hypothetical protein PV327_010912 [Microctonus hyperodae]
MTLPVSIYEALLVQVREITHETILLQQQLSSDLLHDNVNTTDSNHNLTNSHYNYDNNGELFTKKDKKIVDTGPPLSDKKHPTFHQSPSQLETVPESFDAKELAARLLTWRNHNRQHSLELENKGEVVALRHKKQLSTRLPDEFNVVTPSMYSIERVGVEDVDVGSISETSSSSSVLQSRSKRCDLNEATHLRYFTKDPPLAYELDHPPNDRETSTYKNTTSAIPQRYCTKTQSISNNSEQLNSDRREFLRLYTETDENVMEPAEDLQEKSIGHNLELFAQASKCYDEDRSSEEDIKVDSSSCNESRRLSPISHGTWPAVKCDTWTAPSIGTSGQLASITNSHNEMASVMSYSSSSGCSTSTPGNRRLGAKVDVVYSLLGMLSSNEGREDMSATLLAMSNSIDSCLVMRQSGCLPLLVQLIHAPGQQPEIRERASCALHNVVTARSEEKIGRREARVLRLLEQLRDYCQLLRVSIDRERPIDDLELHPGPTIAALMKLSFDEAHRHAMCQLGGVHAVAELIHMDHAAHGSNSDDQSCITLRRYAGMALTNLTFGDDNNKALLCSFRDFMMSLVSQLSSISDDLRQVTASVLRNLSWRADSNSKRTLREVGAVVGLMKAAMEGKKESTLKSILSALWNLSAHCSTNKVDICAMDGALAFLVDKLSYKAPSKTLSIVENAGGILRNISNHIAMREDYRAIVREHGCLQVLLRQLRSPSLTVVSNACGTLWNLSARCPHDQRLLWDLGAVPMLRSLVHSKHKMISMGSSAALKNLLSARPIGSNFAHLDSTARGLGLPTLPSLAARRQRALEQEIDQNLTETCENIEPSTSPTTKDDKFSFKVDDNLADIHPRSTRGIYQITHGNQSVNSGRLNSVPRSESRESMRSITSTHSDTIFERVNRHVNNSTPSEIQLKQQSSSLHSTIGFNTQNISEFHGKTSQLEKKLTMKYKNSTVERLRPDIVNDVHDLHATTSTMSWTTGPEQESTCSIDGELLSPTGSIKSAIKNPTIEFIGKPLVSPTLSHTSETDLFGKYAETDLDEPTNYSLRYAERNLDEDDKRISGYFPAREEQDVEDTIKTYYTEGTPCEISLNSSRAASHSDLQDERVKQLVRINQIQSSKRLTLPPSTLEIHLDSQKIVERTESKCNRDCTTKNADNCSIVEEKCKFDCELKLKEGNELKVIKIQNGVMEQECSAESMASDCDDDDEDLLAACINIGMQNNRHRQSFRRNSLEKGTRGESNLTRYQTSIALDQVENNNINFVDETNELTSQESEHNGLNMKINCNLIGNGCKGTTNGFTSLENSLNIPINNQITNDYQRLNTNHTNNESLTSIEENNIVDESIATSTTMDNPKLLSEPIEMPVETMSSESMESFDSVERSEHVLLELCIKSGKSNNENIPIDKKKAINVTDSASSGISDDSNLIDRNDNNLNKNNPSLKDQADEYRRQRDPDAMIASLDRLTATLVQQTEAMRERELSIMKQSIQSDTWNEDSPNESFPTITMSVPLIGSFKSEIPDDLSQPNLKTQNDDTNNETLSMTTSCLIEREAFKLADAVNAEIYSNSLTFSDDNNIDAMKPPSAMNSLVSLTTSYISPETNVNTFSINGGINTTPSSPLLKNSRKKSLPIGVIAKRAVGQQPQMGSLESLLFNDTNISNISQLDNMKPPSIMDDLILDGGDMENSMVSVSSITSEIADSKETNSITDIKTNSYAMATCIKYAESNTDDISNEYLENINPPSLINEISDIDDTTIDANTDTMCSDTLCSDNDLCTDIYSQAIFNDTIDQTIDYDDDEEDDNDDAAAMQIVTEYIGGLNSSAELTPRKLNKRLTPKQKRQLAKERYKTYTIAAEIVMKEEEERCRNDQGNSLSSNVNVKYSSLTKLTPKQRRQEDRARFQTQVVENPFGECADKSIDEAEKVATISEKSSMLSLKNFGNSQNLSVKRTENHECYRKQTLIDNENDSSASLQTMLQKNASIVLHSLNETENKMDDTVQTLDHETINLVSNDLDAEMCSKTHLADHTSKKFMTFTKKCSSQQHIPSQANESKIKMHETTSKTVNDVKYDIHNETFDISDSENDENEYQPPEESTKRPRIIKPPMSRDASGDSNVSGDKNEQQNSPKGIRGKRKSLYSNPITRKVTPQCSPVKISNNVSSGIPIGRSNSTPIVRTTRATTLRQNTNGSTMKNDISSKITITASRFTTINKNSTITKRSSIPQRGLTSIPTVRTVKRHSTPPASTFNFTKNKIETPKPLERQGTFTKDEPEVENVPTVVIESPKKSKIAKPTRNLPFKNHPIDSKTKTSVRSSQISQQSRLTKCASAEGIISPKVTSTININKRYSVVDNGKTIDNAQSKKKLNGLEQRSNSNSSIASQNSVGGTGKKLTKEATSKIANLWKRVEENRNKQQFEKPDTRQWITKPDVASMATVTSNDADSSESTNFRLFRSSTFEGVPKQTDIIDKTTFNRSSTTKQIDCRPKYGVCYRNSCDLTGMSATKAPCRIPTKFSDTNAGNNSKSTTNVGYSTIILRKQRSIESTDSDQTKRISRLGSFICVECENENVDGPISTVAPPYNCMAKQTHDVATSSADDHQNCLKTSVHVTTV